MDLLTEIDLGSTLLSIAIAAGFIGLTILILRSLIIGIVEILSTFNKKKFTSTRSNTDKNSKGF